MTISFSVAFLGGLLTFLSPCVLPLLPAYLAYLSGTTPGQAADDLSGSQRFRQMKHTMCNALVFTLGFSVAFVLIGILFYSLISQFRMGDGFSRIMGILLIILGGHTIGLYRIPFLMRDTRAQQKDVSKLTLLSSFLFGLLFGAGWSPCIGPILAGILALSATSGEIGTAASLMAVFSAGLAVPFLLSALLANRMGQWARKNARYTVWFERLTGLLIIGIGLSMLLISVHDMSNWLAENVPWASALLDAESSLVESK
ncbi:MAG: cytochrome C biogenesis protein [Gammaproteobacteria bacterium]|nr:MAG: cytochrome C biogenesis protein [Pseudomonadota bacterium]PIE38652.1 MAG: cytochrome C biogenesis protein [Gammaproteobacteria bacterium]